MARTKQHRRTRLRRRLLGWVLASAIIGPSDAQELVPIPEPSLEGAEAGFRQRISNARDALDRLPVAATDSERGAAYGHLGSLYLLSELRAPAAAAFTNARHLDPTEPRWPYFSGLIWTDMGDLERAEQALRVTSELRPDKATVHLRLAEIVRRAGRLEEAEESFQQLLAKPLSAGEEAFARFGLGRIAFDQGRFSDAAAHLEAVRRAAPEASAVGRILGLAYRELGRMDEARAALRESGEVTVPLPDTWIAELQRIDLGAYLADAVKARLDEDYDEAARLYRLAVKADEERRDPKTADALRGLAEILFVQGDIEGALEAVGDAVRARPGRADLQAKLGEFLTLAGRPAAAVEPYRRAVGLAPGDPQAKLGLGRALAMTGRHEEALQHYDQSLTLSPEDVEARALKARALSRLGRHAEAAGELARALTLDPGNVRVRLAHVDALARSGDTAAVRESLEEGVASSDDPRLVATLIQVLLGDPDPARRDPQRALQLASALLREDPSVAHAQVLARALFGSGRLADAVALQERALDEARSGGAPDDELAGMEQTLRFYRDRLVRKDKGGPS